MSRRIRNSRGRFTSSPPIDVRSERDIPKLEALIHSGPVTFVLVYADWCGHCQNYKPTWSKFEKTPGRVANIARIQETMLPQSSIGKAKIEGYPSVIKVTPTGEIEEYKVPGSRHPMTNAVPYMREEHTMTRELTTPSPTSRNTHNTRNTPSYISSPTPRKPTPRKPTPRYLSNDAPPTTTVDKGGVQGGMAGQLGGAIRRSIRRFLTHAPKSSFKDLTRAFIPQHHKRRHSRHSRHTFKSPKRFSRRGSTRRNRTRRN